jgi:hypothetical protein
MKFITSTVTIVLANQLVPMLRTASIFELKITTEEENEKKAKEYKSV